MSLGRRRVRERRQRVVLAVAHTAKWILVLAVLGGVGLYAYTTGSELAQDDLVRLAAERDAARATAATREADAARQEAEAATARAEAAALRARVAAEVPTGTVADLLAELRTRLDGGLPEPRLRQAIRDAAPLRPCDGPPIVRRFRITPGDRALPEDAATFFEGLVRIQANAPAGFETLSRTMVVTFSGQGLPAPVTMTGVPATQGFRIGHHEAVLTVTASPIPGFAQATVPTCRPD